MTSLPVLERSTGIPTPLSLPPLQRPAVNISHERQSPVQISWKSGDASQEDQGTPVYLIVLAAEGWQGGTMPTATKRPMDWFVGGGARL